MPGRHDVRPADVRARRLGAVLALAHERDLHDFAELLLVEQLGPRLEAIRRRELRELDAFTAISWLCGERRLP